MALVEDIEKAQKDMDVFWTKKMASFESRLDAITSPSNPTLLELREEFTVFKTLVSDMLKVLRHQVSEATKVLDSMDMRSRRKVLLFNGIPEEPEVDVEAKVIGLIHNKLGLTHVTSSSLKRCHRLGVKGSENVRPVLVHFSSHDTKSEVWRSKAKLKGSSVSMSEFLTRSRQLVHKGARKHFGMRNVWTLDGVIYIKPPGEARVKLSTQEELDSLVQKYPSVDQSSEASSDDESSKQNSESNINRHQRKARRKPAQAEDSKRSRRNAPKK